MEGTKKPPRAYIPSRPAVKSSQPQVAIFVAKRTHQRISGCKSTKKSRNFQILIHELQEFRELFVTLHPFSIIIRWKRRF